MSGDLQDKRLKGLRVVFEASDQGGYSVECLDLPGCVSEGNTFEEAEHNIQLAMNDCLGILFEDFIASLASQAAVSSGERQEVFSVSLPHVVPAAA